MRAGAFSIRAASVALAAGAWACSSPHGMTLGFVAPPETSEVHVFLGDLAVEGGSGSGVDCAMANGEQICTFAPPPGIVKEDAAGGALRGPGWTSVQPGPLVVAVDHDLIGWIEIDTDGADAEEQAIIAVGYDGSDITALTVRNDVAILPGMVAEVEMTAGTAASLDVGVWTNGSDTCVAAPHGNNDFEFIVPAEDVNCAIASCPDTAWEYCGVSEVAAPSSTPGAGCFSAAAGSGSAADKACRFGNEGAPCYNQNPGCAAPPDSCVLPSTGPIACIVPQACGSGCTDWASCNAAPLPGVTCRFASTPGQNSTPCQGLDPTELDITAPAILPFLGARSCEQLFLMGKVDTVAAAQSVTLADQAGTVALASIAPQLSCTNNTLSLMVGQGTVVPVTDFANLGTVTLGLQVASPNTVGSAVDLMIPLTIEVGSCTTPITELGCSFTNPDAANQIALLAPAGGGGSGSDDGSGSDGSGSGSGSGVNLDAGVDAPGDAAPADAGVDAPPDAASNTFDFPCP